MNTKQEISERFISHHKNNDVNDWLLQSDDLEDIYIKMIGSEFGACDDDLAGNCVIEISSHDHIDGRSELFEFVEPDFNIEDHVTVKTYSSNSVIEINGEIYNLEHTSDSLLIFVKMLDDDGECLYIDALDFVNSNIPDLPETYAEYIADKLFIILDKYL